MDDKSGRFDLRQLEFFCAVARRGSFTKAAEDVGVAQSSLSEQIARLEQSLESALFERLARRIELTPAGEALLPRAQAILQDAAALPQYLETVRSESGGVLRVGAIPSILPYFLAPRLREFVERFPEIDLHLRETTTAELIRQLEEGAIDIGIMSLPVEGNNMVMKELFREAIHLAVPEFHALAGADQVQLRRVSCERLLILKDGHCLREETLTICDRARARFAARFEADQFASIFELIRAGFGVSLVPEMARHAAVGCRLIPIEPRATRRVGYVRLERRYVSRVVESFTGWLTEISKDRSAGGYAKRAATGVGSASTVDSISRVRS
jgi:LysR family hydrogen peroxide-inducible transcriptional activator